MKKMLFLVCVCLFGSVVLGQPYSDYQNLPNPKMSGLGFVLNYDNILTQNETIEINNNLTALQNSTGVQMATVVLNDISPDEKLNLREIGTNLFNK